MKSFEDILKDKAENFSREAPPGVWEKVRHSLRFFNLSLRLKPLLGIFSVIILAAVALLYGNSEEPKTSVQNPPGTPAINRMKTDTSSGAEETSKDKAVFSQDAAGTGSDKVPSAQKIKSENRHDAQPVFSENPIPARTVKTTIDSVPGILATALAANTPETSKTATPADEPDTAAAYPGDSATAALRHAGEAYDSLQLPPGSVINTLAAITAADTTKPAGTGRSTPADSIRKSRWQISFSGSMAFTGKQSFSYVPDDPKKLGPAYPIDTNHQAYTDYQAFRKNSDKKLWLPQFSLGLTYAAIPDKLSLSTGLSFIQLGERLSTGTDYPVLLFSAGPDGPRQTTAIGPDTFYVVQANYNDYNTAFGNSHLDNRFKYISVPLGISWHVLNRKKISLTADVSVSYNILAEADGWYYDRNNYVYIPITDKLRKSLFRPGILSNAAGFGFRYRLSERLALDVKASKAFYWQSVYKDRSYIQAQYQQLRLNIGFAISLNKVKQAE